MTCVLLHRSVWELQTRFADDFLLPLDKLRAVPSSASTARKTRVSGNTVAGQNTRCFPIMRVSVKVENGFHLPTDVSSHGWACWSRKDSDFPLPHSSAGRGAETCRMGPLGKNGLREFFLPGAPFLQEKELAASPGADSPLPVRNNYVRASICHPLFRFSNCLEAAWGNGCY